MCKVFIKSIKYLFVLLVMISACDGFSQEVQSPYNVKILEEKIKTLKNELIKKNPDTIIVENYINQSEVYFKLKKYDSSAYFAYKAYYLSKKIGYDFGFHGVIRNIIGINNKFANYSESLKYAFESMYLLIEKKDTTNLLNTYHLISLIYSSAKDYNNKLLYAQKLIALAEKRDWKNAKPDHRFYENRYAPLADAYISKKILDSALFYSLKDYQYAVKSKDSIWLAFSYGYIGETNLLLNNPDIAISYFLKKKQLLIQKNEPQYLSLLYIDFAKAYQLKGNIDSSLYYAKEALKMSTAFDDTEHKLKSLEILYNLSKQKNDMPNELIYQNKYLILKDSLFTLDKIRDVENLSIKEIIKQTEIEENARLARLEKEKNLVLAAIGFFIPTFLSIVFLIGRWGKRKSKLITSLGLASLLMLFEFISLLLHPFIEQITHHNVALMYVILLIIASALVPIHHKMEGFVKSKLSE